MKIGSTNDIQDRCNKIKNKYNETPYVLHCFECEQNVELEKFLHNDEYILSKKYFPLLNGQTHQELYFIESLRVYDTIMRIVISNFYRYKYRGVNEMKALRKLQREQNKTLEKEKELKQAEKELKQVELQLKQTKEEREKDLDLRFAEIQLKHDEKEKEKEIIKLQLDLKREEQKTIILYSNNNLTNINSNSLNIFTPIKETKTISCQTKTHSTLDKFCQTEQIYIEKKENPCINESFNHTYRMKRNCPLDINDQTDIVSFNNENGPLVQMYDCIDLTKVKDYYYGMMEALRQIPEKYGDGFKCINRSRIIDASNQKIEYLGHRWNLLDRSQIEKIQDVFDIGETKNAFKQKKGLIAIVDRDETYIKHVFSKALEVASFLHIKTPSLISTSLNHKNGHLFNFDDIKLKMWDEIPQNLKDEYLETNDLPTQEKRNHGIKVVVLDAKTLHVIEKLPCLDSVSKKYKTSGKLIREKAECWNTDQGIFRGSLRFRYEDD